MAKMENTPSKNQKKLNSHLPSLWIYGYLFVLALYIGLRV